MNNTDLEQVSSSFAIQLSNKELKASESFWRSTSAKDKDKTYTITDSSSANEEQVRVRSSTGNRDAPVVYVEDIGLL
jgi:hypothetical protein